MSRVQAQLIDVVLLDFTVAALVVAGFWLGVTLFRITGRKAGYSLAPLGFSRPRRGMLAGIGVGAAAGIGAIVLSAILNPLSALVLERLGYPTESRVQQPLIRGLVAWIQENPGLAVPVVVLVIVLFAPAVEELVFRGAVFNGLYQLVTLMASRSSGKVDPSATARKVSFALCALVSSALFALLHLEPVLLPSLLVLAVVLCALFQWSQSLVPSFVAHATFNSFTTALVILSGLGVFEIPL